MKVLDYAATVLTPGSTVLGANAAGATKRFNLGGTVNPYQYGGDPALTDNSTAFTAMLADASAVDIYIPPGIWKLASKNFAIGTQTKRFGGPGTLQYTGAASAASAGDVLLYVTTGGDKQEVYGVTFDVPRNNSSGAMFAIAIEEFSTAITNFSLHDIYIKNGASIGLYMHLANAGTGNIRLYNNRFENSGQACVYADAMIGGLTFRNNDFIGDGTQTYHLVSLQGGDGSTDVITLRDNLFYKNSSAGFGLYVSDCAPGSVITGNSILEGIFDAIEVNTTSHDITNLEISNNLLANSAVTSQEVGIGLGAFASHSITNSSIKGNTIIKRGRPGVFLGLGGTGGAINGIEVSGNYIKDCNQNLIGTATIDSGIVLTDGGFVGVVGTSTNPNVVRDNTIVSSDGKTKYGIAENRSTGTVDYTIASNNYASGMGNAQHSLTGTHSGIDTLASTAPRITTATTETVTAIDSSIIFNAAGTVTLTLPSAAAFPGRWLNVKTITAQLLNSASSNVKPIGSNTAAAAILVATAGRWAELQSDGTNWVIMMAN